MGRDLRPLRVARLDFAVRQGLATRTRDPRRRQRSMTPAAWDPAASRARRLDARIERRARSRSARPSRARRRKHEENVVKRLMAHVCRSAGLPETCGQRLRHSYGIDAAHRAMLSGLYSAWQRRSARMLAGSDFRPSHDDGVRSLTRWGDRASRKAVLASYPPVRRDSMNPARDGSRCVGHRAEREQLAPLGAAVFAATHATGNT